MATISQVFVSVTTIIPRTWQTGNNTQTYLPPTRKDQTNRDEGWPQSSLGPDGPKAAEVSQGYVGLQLPPNPPALDEEHQMLTWVYSSTLLATHFGKVVKS